VATVQKMGKKTSFLKLNYYILFNKNKVKNILLSKKLFLYKIQNRVIILATDYSSAKRNYICLEFDKITFF